MCWTARGKRRRGAKLLVDEFFIDFVGVESAALGRSVVKSYGKLLATPGLRIGAVVYRHKSPPSWRINGVAGYTIYAVGPQGLRRHKARTLAFLKEEKPR